MNEIGEFLKVPVENLDAFIGHEIFVIHDSTAPEDSGAWELLREVRKELLREVRKELLREQGVTGQPDTMARSEPTP